MSTQDDITSALRMVAGGASALAGALPEPAAIVVRILGAAAGAASVAIDGGKTEAEVVAAIHRIRSLDTSAADAAVDAIVAAKPSRADQLQDSDRAHLADIPKNLHVASMLTPDQLTALRRAAGAIALPAIEPDATTVIVNGRSVAVSPVVSGAAIAKLAGIAEGRTPSITYRRGLGGASGMLTASETVHVAPGMVFDAYVTDAA